MNDRCRTTLRRVTTTLPALGVAVLVTAVPSAFAANDHAASNATTTATTQRAAHQPDSSSTNSTAGSGTDTAASHRTSGTAGTSGDASSPQPQSTADQNSGGANGQCPGGPYCSTRSGLPSYNGSDTGAAVGKPCAGCVGKADNKNPAGQFPNGSDANNGYECDGNQGIGQTNPAHTGCTTTPVVCDTAVEDCGGGHHPGGHTPGGHHVRQPTRHGTGRVLGLHEHRGTVTQPDVIAAHTTRAPAAQPQALPFTGSVDLRLAGVLSGCLMVLGTAGVVLGRRRTSSGAA